MPVPNPTPIYRFIHVDNLDVCLQRGGLHAPNNTPKDGLVYKTIHNEDIQAKRSVRRLHCGPRGVVHDYVPFYFGYLSPMLLQLQTGQVTGYAEGQEPLIYLVSSVQAVCDAGCDFVFSDGHGIAAFTGWYDELADLNQVDWEMVYERYWADTTADPDRQRRKQAEFLVHRFCDWEAITEIAVLNEKMRRTAEETMSEFPSRIRRPVHIRPNWYYY